MYMTLVSYERSLRVCAGDNKFADSECSDRFIFQARVSFRSRANESHRKLRAHLAILRMLTTTARVKDARTRPSCKLLHTMKSLAREYGQERSYNRARGESAVETAEGEKRQ